MSVSEGWKARSRKKCAIKLSFFLFISFFLINSTSYAEEIQFKADSMTGVSGSKTDETKLSGNAFVKTSTMEIKADSITLDGEDFRYITAQGSVEGKNTETKMDFTCGKLRYDRNTKLARLEDGVHMVDLENSVTIDSQIIEYNQSKEIATMQIGVSIKQKDNTCTSAFAIYRKGAQMLEMSGNPKIIQGADTFRAQEIILNLNSQEITLSGRVSGTVTDSKKSEPKDEKTGGDGENAGKSENAEGKSPDEEKKPELPPITDILNKDAEEKKN
jgi:lipopolysaccharide export system protein LptA